MCSTKTIMIKIFCNFNFPMTVFFIARHNRYFLYSYLWLPSRIISRLWLVWKIPYRWKIELALLPLGRCIDRKWVESIWASQGAFFTDLILNRNSFLLAKLSNFADSSKMVMVLLVSLPRHLPHWGIGRSLHFKRHRTWFNFPILFIFNSLGNFIFKVHMLLLRINVFTISIRILIFAFAVSVSISFRGKLR